MLDLVYDCGDFHSRMLLWTAEALHNLQPLLFSLADRFIINKSGTRNHASMLLHLVKHGSSIQLHSCSSSPDSIC
jgi:hypothetical protein